MKYDVKHHTIPYSNLPYLGTMYRTAVLMYLNTDVLHLTAPCHTLPYVTLPNLTLAYLTVPYRPHDV